MDPTYRSTKARSKAPQTGGIEGQQWSWARWRREKGRRNAPGRARITRPFGAFGQCGRGPFDFPAAHSGTPWGPGRHSPRQGTENPSGNEEGRAVAEECDPGDRKMTCGGRGYGGHRPHTVGIVAWQRIRWGGNSPTGARFRNADVNARGVENER